MNPNRISAATNARLAHLAATNLLSREYGEAIAQAWIEANTTTEQTATLRPGQVVRLTNMPDCKRVVIVGVRPNGIWIRRSATEGEFQRRGVDQVKERVSIKTIVTIVTAND